MGDVSRMSSIASERDFAKSDKLNLYFGKWGGYLYLLNSYLFICAFYAKNISVGFGKKIRALVERRDAAHRENRPLTFTELRINFRGAFFTI